MGGSLAFHDCSRSKGGGVVYSKDISIQTEKIWERATGFN